MANNEGPTRPTNHPSESKSPGWKGQGDLLSEQTAAGVWNKVANERAKNHAEQPKENRIADRAKEIAEQFSQAKTITKQPER